MTKLMSVADVDGDGLISLHEFLDAAKGTNKETSVLQQLQMKARKKRGATEGVKAKTVVDKKEQ